MTSGLASGERADLCNALEGVGPAAPTLCEGWDAFAMAAHLYVRERDPFAGPGILLPGPFAAITARRMQAAKKLGFPALVSAVRRPPPLYWRLVPDALQFVEFFIHHEDVRRANGERRREVSEEIDDAIWRWLGGAARVYARDVSCGLSLERSGGDTREVKGGQPVATVAGPPGELLLFLAGRGAVAEVEVRGSDEAVACVRDSSFGI